MSLRSRDAVFRKTNVKQVGSILDKGEPQTMLRKGAIQNVSLRKR